MSFVDWFRYFSELNFDVCVFPKGVIDEGNWKLDVAARLTFDNYVTVEHSTANAGSRKTPGQRHFGILPGLGLWRHRQKIRRFVRSLGPKAVVCVSNAGRRRLVDGYGFRAASTVTIRNGIDPEVFRRDIPSGNNWRRRHGIPVGALLFGAVGRLDVGKRFEIALDGFDALLARSPSVDARFVLVGDGPHRQALEERARQMKSAAKIILVPFCERAWEPLSAIDVFVMPSIMEGLPLALLEAMACGCCPIATSVGGIPEAISSPELGWLVPVDDSGAFADAMVDAALLHPAKRVAIGQKARAQVKSAFNGFTQFNLLVDHIESLGSSSATRGRGRSGRPAISAVPVDFVSSQRGAT
jgi:glycosyltransferase involved in cell wall biosynthesis